jgi:hypothetical protein
LLGICFWGGVLEGVVEEIGEGRMGVDPELLELSRTRQFYPLGSVSSF